MEILRAKSTYTCALLTDFLWMVVKLYYFSCTIWHVYTYISSVAAQSVQKVIDKIFPRAMEFRYKERARSRTF